MSKYYIPGYGEIDDNVQNRLCGLGTHVTVAMRAAVKRKAKLKGLSVSDYLKDLIIADLNSDPHPLPENDSD